MSSVHFIVEKSLLIFHFAQYLSVILYSGRHVSPQMRLDDRETTQRVSVFVL